ncbi:MAG: hypothetical protein H0X45_01790 [Planctomycetes bacterium]|nr:hypothetical protein [Planctomycetota bacterium]
MVASSPAPSDVTCGEVGPAMDQRACASASAEVSTSTFRRRHRRRDSQFSIPRFAHAELFGVALHGCAMTTT